MRITSRALWSFLLIAGTASATPVQFTGTTTGTIDVPPGPQGPQGVPGPAGPAGPAGPQGPSGSGSGGNITAIDPQAGVPFTDPRNAAVVEIYRQSVAGSNVPLSLLDRLIYSYDEAAQNARNDDRYFPLLPDGAPCPSGGSWPKCNFEKDNVSTFHHMHFKQGLSQGGATWAFQQQSTGPGDSIALIVQNNTVSPTPAGGDEGAAALYSRSYDMLNHVPTGKLEVPMTPGSPTFQTKLWTPELMLSMGEWQLVVFPDQAIRLNGGDGDGVGKGGLSDYDNGRRTWVVGATAEIPSSVRSDPAVGHTRWCLGLDRGQGTDNTGTYGAGYKYRKWLLVARGPGELSLDKSFTLAPNELAPYAPYLGGWSGAHINQIPGVVWIDFAGGAPDDDAVLAPCEILHYPEFTVDPKSGKPAYSPNGIYTMRLLSPSGDRTIPAGAKWELLPIGYPSQIYNQVIHTEAVNRGFQPAVFNRLVCVRGDKRECQEQRSGQTITTGDRNRPKGTNGSTDSGMNARFGNEVVGSTAMGAFHTSKSQADAETGATLSTSIWHQDWATDAADRVPTEMVRKGNPVSTEGPMATRAFNTKDLSWRVQRLSKIETQEVEVTALYPVLFKLPPNQNASCNTVCSVSGALVCAGSIENGTFWDSSGSCARTSVQSGASGGHVCECKAGS